MNDERWGGSVNSKTIRNLKRVSFVLPGGLLAATMVTAAQPAAAPTITALTTIDVTQRDTPPTGPHAVIVEHDPGLATHTIYRPKELGATKHPVLVWGEGGCAKNGLMFTEFLSEIASHGFVVIGAHTNSTRGGAVHEAAIDWIVAENARYGSAYFGKLDLTKIGAAGHSQGAGATITAGAGIPGPMPIVTSIAMMPISAFERPHLGQHEASMLLISATDDDRANAVAEQAMSDVTTELVEAQFIGVHGDAARARIADHGFYAFSVTIELREHAE